MGVLSFAISIIGIMMSFFENLRLASFAVAILGIIVAIISAYYKDKKESKEGKDAKKDSRALEVGAIILAGATCLTYYVYMILGK